MQITGARTRMRIWCCGSWRNLCTQRCMSSGTLVESVREVEKRRPWWACLESRGWNLSSVLSTSNNIKIKLENDIIKFLFRKVTLVMIGREPGWAVKQANVMGTYAKAALYLLGALPLVSTPPMPTMSCGRCEHTTLAHNKSSQVNLMGAQ